MICAGYGYVVGAAEDEYRPSLQSDSGLKDPPRPTFGDEALEAPQDRTRRETTSTPNPPTQHVLKSASSTDNSPHLHLAAMLALALFPLLLLLLLL